MIANHHKPVIFIAFANDRDDQVRYLRNLPEEARRLRAALVQAERAGQCELVERANATLGDILDVFQDLAYRDRVAVFHYGGHANGYQLLLESTSGAPATADAGGLAAFLGVQRSLHLVFLNGCSTHQQVQGLLDAHVPAVIATSQAIDDGVAAEFAGRFYQALGGGKDLHTSYDEAAAAVCSACGQDTRALYWVSEEAATGAWPWELYLQPGAELAARWSLPKAAARATGYQVGDIHAGIVNVGGVQTFAGDLSFNVDFSQPAARPELGGKGSWVGKLDESYTAGRDIQARLEEVTRRVQALMHLEPMAREALARLTVQLGQLLQGVPLERAQDALKVCQRAEALVKEIGAAAPDPEVVTIIGESLQRAAQVLADAAPGLLIVAAHMVAQTKGLSEK
jgi:hypothetical protein